MLWGFFLTQMILFIMLSWSLPCRLYPRHILNYSCHIRTPFNEPSLTRDFWKFCIFLPRGLVRQCGVWSFADHIKATCQHCYLLVLAGGGGKEEEMMVGGCLLEQVWHFDWYFGFLCGRPLQGVTNFEDFVWFRYVLNERTYLDNNSFVFAT